MQIPISILVAITYYKQTHQNCLLHMHYIYNISLYTTTSNQSHLKKKSSNIYNETSSDSSFSCQRLFSQKVICLLIKTESYQKLRENRSSHQRCSIKKVFLVIS